jgi:hypothetical protein
MKTENAIPEFTRIQDAGKVLSIILDVDQANASNRNRNYEATLNARLRDLESGIADKADLAAFRQCAEAGRQLIASHRPQARSVVVFLQSNGNTSMRELDVPLSTEVVWQEHPHIRPLVEAGDEFKEVLVVLLDGSHARLLTTLLGKVTEHPEIVNPFPASHTHAGGKDKAKSQTVFHRKSDEREHHYLKSVAEAVESLAEARSIRRIVLAGNNVRSKELHPLLSDRAKKCVVSFAILPVAATISDISAVLRDVQARSERDVEAEKVDLLIEGRHGKTIVGIGGTLEALAALRVSELVYAEGVSIRGALCENCGVIVTDGSKCPKCQVVLPAAEDALDLIIGGALETGAAVEQVRGAAARKLSAVGGIGAFLRY